jgi:hypothetical protein
MKGFWDDPFPPHIAAKGERMSTTEIDATIQARAARGAAWLDKKLGRGWRRKIKRSKLEMSVGRRGPNGCGCIITQLYGDYQGGEEPLGFDSGGRFAVSHGFLLPEGRRMNDGYYTALTEAWLQELRA